MKKTKIAAVALAAVMSVSMLPQTTVLPSLGVTASAASTSSKLAAPTGIKGTVSESQIKLSWNEVDGADAYIIYKYDSATKTLKQYKSVTGTACTVKDLTAGTTYKFKVAALVKVNGKYTVQTKSDEISATTAKAASKLAAPTGFKASVSESQIKLSWDEVDGADAYIIYKYNSSTKKYEQYKSVFGTNCTVTGLTAGTKYYFKVAALVKVDGKYTVQTESNVISATTKSSMRTVPAELVIPSKGATKSEVLRDCGIANYTYDSTNKWYIGEVLHLGINSDIYISFKSDDTFDNLGVFTPLSYSNYLSCLNVTKDVFGYDYDLSYNEEGDLNYTWIVGNLYYSIGYNSKLKSVSTVKAYI